MWILISIGLVFIKPSKIMEYEEWTICKECESFLLVPKRHQFQNESFWAVVKWWTILFVSSCFLAFPSNELCISIDLDSISPVICANQIHFQLNRKKSFKILKLKKGEEKRMKQWHKIKVIKKPNVFMMHFKANWVLCVRY